MIRFYQKKIEDLTDIDRKEVENFISKCQSTVIATNNTETGTRLSVLSNIPGQKANELYFITDVRSNKARNLAVDKNAQLLMYIDNEAEMVFQGEVEFEHKLSVIKEKWQDWANEFFPNGPEDEHLCLMKFMTKEVRAFFM